MAWIFWELHEEMKPWQQNLSVWAIFKSLSELQCWLTADIAPLSLSLHVYVRMYIHPGQCYCNPPCLRKEAKVSNGQLDGCSMAVNPDPEHEDISGSLGRSLKTLLGRGTSRKSTWISRRKWKWSPVIKKKNIMYYSCWKNLKSVHFHFWKNSVVVAHWLQ